MKQSSQIRSEKSQKGDENMGTRLLWRQLVQGIQNENSSGNSWYLPDIKLLYLPWRSPSAQKSLIEIKTENQKSSPQSKGIYLLAQMVARSWTGLSLSS